ncbi:unnamed protein product [Notodromas monacha]|uniref:Methionine aminopeptidase n=1 Tax=Notodromas monacha TaxID=399045 RepID=A0A7R9BI74_9CRUS|nr:unnamed protein product [Notodromas monacha]CAG0915967.1 unnamed protein product [Notodromas monacha]
MRKVPEFVKLPPYAVTGVPAFPAPGIDLKDDRELESMRRVGALARAALNEVKRHIQPGITTDYLDLVIHEFGMKANAYPSTLNYRGYPKSCCTSVNNVVCHGIPDDRPLVSGDLISVDVTFYLDGFHGDCAETFLVGNVDEQGKRLTDVAKRCRDAAVNACGPGVPLSKIGDVIEEITDAEGLTILPMFAGHGIGSYFHGAPDVLHFRNDNAQVMCEGMTFTIEPAVGQGTEEVAILSDGWTAVTRDDSRAAQFEHTVAITAHGVEILTPY